jgi:predicted neuraminidase
MGKRRPAPNNNLCACLAAVALTAVAGCVARRSHSSVPRPLDQQSGFVKAEFIYEHAPFPSCHASTIAETKAGLVAAWFGGTAERNPDVGIWVSRQDGGRWSAPIEAATGVQPDGKRLPCWNPVLFQPKEGPLLLFYKVGPSPSTWWGMMMTSADHGRTWSKPARLPEGVLGPIKNKPVEFADGTLLCGSSTEHDGWRVHFEWTRDFEHSWEKTPPINDGRAVGVIQPGLLKLDDSTVIALMRSTKGRIYAASTQTHGRAWSDPEPTVLPNPNSGIDAVTLRDGRCVLVYNHTERGRSPLNIAVSKNGRDWQAAVVLENQPGEYSYPAVIQTTDGFVHITYTWKRQRIKHVVVDPAKFHLRDMPDGQWPE